MCQENKQVEFEFGFGRIIFGRVMPLGLRKIPLFGRVTPFELRKIILKFH